MARRKKTSKKLQFKKAAKNTYGAVKDLVELDYFQQTWKNILVLALIVIFLTIVVDLILVRFIHLDEELLHMIELIDYGAIAIMALDVLYHLYKAEDKVKYLTQNPLLILSFLPYLSVFRLFRFLIVLKDVAFIFGFIKIYLHKHHIQEKLGFGGKH